jgi:hypothetical protein
VVQGRVVFIKGYKHMDYYIKEFLKTNKLETGVPFKVKELNRLVVVDADGSFKYVDSDGVLVLGDVFSILSGAYHVELNNTKYSCGDTYYFVSDAYNVKKSTWGNNIYDYALLNMGNVFTTRFEADNHKEEILNKCREINTKDVVSTGNNDTPDFSTPTLGGTVTNNGITYNIKDKLKPLSDKVKDMGDTATILNKKYKDKVSGMAMSIDKDSIDSGKYKGYTLHNGVKRDFDINATSLGEAIREALKKSFN